MERARHGRLANPHAAKHRSAIAALLALVLAPDAGALARKKFDFVVGVDGDFKAMMAAAAKKASSSYRYHVFFPDGQYDIGSLVGDANQMSTFATSNVSFIGQSTDKTVIFNKSITEGISITSTLLFDHAENLYLQDLTIMNKAVYGNVALYTQTGRHVAVRESGTDRLVYKNVKLLSTQDTYYTKGKRTYWENGTIHGTTDFICGGGDVFFQQCLIYALKKSALTAPATTTTWGYVFNECTIDGDVTGFTLGRSWGDAREVYLNTTMKKLPVETGWGDPMNSVPKVFAEYKSKDASGKLLDLSKRRTSYTKDATTVTLNPVLTDAEAAKYTLANVLGGSDNWKPDELTRQVAAPVVTREGSLLKWNDDPKALCWVVFKNGKYVTSVATNSYDAGSLSGSDVVTVRAANEMGGLGPASGSTTSIRSDRPSTLRHEIGQDGRTIRIHGRDLSNLTVVLRRADGSLAQGAVASVDPDATTAQVRIDTPETGIHFLVYATGGERGCIPVVLGGSRKGAVR